MMNPGQMHKFRMHLKKEADKSIAGNYLKKEARKKEESHLFRKIWLTVFCISSIFVVPYSLRLAGEMQGAKAEHNKIIKSRAAHDKVIILKPYF